MVTKESPSVNDNILVAVLPWILPETVNDNLLVAVLSWSLLGFPQKQTKLVLYLKKITLQ